MSIKSTAEGDSWKDMLLNHFGKQFCRDDFAQYVASDRYGEINKHFCQEFRVAVFFCVAGSVSLHASICV